VIDAVLKPGGDAATAMPAAAIMLPCLALVGWVPFLSPTMNRLKATM